MDSATTVLRWEAAGHGILLHGDRRLHAAFQAQAAAEYIDFAPALQRAVSTFRRRLLQQGSAPAP